MLTFIREGKKWKSEIGKWVLRLHLGVWYNPFHSHNPTICKGSGLCIEPLTALHIKGHLKQFIRYNYNFNNDDKLLSNVVLIILRFRFTNQSIIFLIYQL